MTAASATPQQMKERLLQAIDGQSNIHNMVAVLEVISHLEKYPITKEALEETRLGKLINDVRKKTKDEDLAKRAKKLLRNWQKLIEPGQNEALTKAAPGTPGSTNGGTHPCRTDVSSPSVTPGSKPVSELKSRTDIYNSYSPKAERSNRKRKGEPRDCQYPPAKVSKTSAIDAIQNSTPSPPVNGIGGSPESPLNSLEADLQLSERGGTEPHDNDKQAKIPVNAVRPHSSTPGLVKAPSTSSLLKTAVMQQQQQQLVKLEELATAGQSQPRSPRRPYLSPRASKPPPSPPPRLSEKPESPKPWSSLSSNGPTEAEQRLHREPAPGQEGEGKKRKKYRPRDYTVSLVGQPAEENTKPGRLKGRSLTFDPVTGQIKPLTPKESYQTEAPPPVPSPPAPQRTEPQQQKPLPPPPSPFQQTNWKELSRNEIIQSYLNSQSTVLTSSGAQTPGAHFFMTEYLKQEEHHVKEARKTHVLVPDRLEAELPGVSRELSPEDVDRVHQDKWPGVNGCYDTKDSWYDWTQCIQLDPHGDESRLNILPYVCLD